MGTASWEDLNNDHHIVPVAVPETVVHQPSHIDELVKAKAHRVACDGRPLKGRQLRIGGQHLLHVFQRPLTVLECQLDTPPERPRKDVVIVAGQKMNENAKALPLEAAAQAHFVTGRSVKSWRIQSRFHLLQTRRFELVNAPHVSALMGKTWLAD